MSSLVSNPPPGARTSPQPVRRADEAPLLQRLLSFINPIDGRYEDLWRATGG